MNVALFLPAVRSRSWNPVPEPVVLMASRPYVSASLSSALAELKWDPTRKTWAAKLLDPTPDKEKLKVQRIVSGSGLGSVVRASDTASPEARTIRSAREPFERSLRLLLEPNESHCTGLGRAWTLFDTGSSGLSGAEMVAADPGSAAATTRLKAKSGPVHETHLLSVREVDIVAPPRGCRAGWRETSKSKGTGAG